MSIKCNFPDDFLWGVGSSAYQIEGGWNQDGKGESIWDRWVHIPGKTLDTGDVACDHYNHVEQDIKLLKKMGVKAYRFSIAWTRIFPNGIGKKNEKGIEFYRKLLNLLRENNIKSVVTLFHWDLPQKLADLGGWMNPASSDWFDCYARCVFNALGNLVDYWTTFNEPYVVAYLGYFDGRFPPGIQDYNATLSVCHNLLLGHGKAVKTYREMGYKGQIGITLDLFPPKPFSESMEDTLATQRDIEAHLGWFADPIMKGKYPEYTYKWFCQKGLSVPELTKEETDIINLPIDFLGINFYAGVTIKDSPEDQWPLCYKHVEGENSRMSKYYSIHAEDLYFHLKYISERYDTNIIITENGIGNFDYVNRNGQIADSMRIDYIQRHLEQCYYSIQDGVKLKGYIHWCFLDDFEWPMGVGIGGDYTHRMGMVYVDYKNLNRTLKDSAYWYKEVIQNNGFEI